MKEFKVSFCLKDGEYLTALRLIAGAICACEDVNIDSMEDFKLCVNEAVLILRNSGYENADVTFSRGDKIQAKLIGSGGSANLSDNGYSLTMLKMLISDCELRQQNGIIEGITLTL